MSTLRDRMDFRQNAADAVKDASLRRTMRTATDVFATMRTRGLNSLPIDTWRDEASAIRQTILDDLLAYLDQFTAAATKAGAVVHRARDAESARETIFHILKDRGVRKIVKSKSMVTEEIELNPYLEHRGMSVVETDLGEYIVQLAGEPPSHILAPALHMNRKQVGRLFAEKLGVEYSEDPEVLTRIARDVLRKEFLAADAGISGANLAVAETGSLVIFTNEGNGRMVTTLPKLHVAVFTIEKLIPSLRELPTFIRLLPRSATGQPLSSYMSVVTGTRKAEETCGAQELHIVLLDNGRTGILAGEYREILKCIRCSACINVCPVYRVIGGHAYGSTYPGPMGIVLTNLLEGIDKSHPLLDASTLCGACVDVCPVRVPLTDLIRRLRERRVTEGLTPMAERAEMAAFGLVAGSPALFDFAQRVSRLSWPLLEMLSGPGTLERLPRPVKDTFRRRMS